MTTTTDTTPRVWIGCLHCYSSGRLVGDWFDAAAADEVTLADVHESSGFDYAECEGLWVMAHQNIPVQGELDPITAAAWGQCLTEVDEHLRPAMCAWVESGNYVTEGNTDLPSISDFEERYQGHWDTFAEYAENLDDVPEEIARYFNWDAWTRDLAMDYSVYDDPEGGVFVFRDL